MAAMQRLLGTSDKFVNPNFGSAFIFELRMDKRNNYFVRVLNKNTIFCLDYGVDILTSRIEESTFPWILSNVFDAETKKPLGDVEDRKVVEINGYRVILNI